MTLLLGRLERAAGYAWSSAKKDILGVYRDHLALCLRCSRGLLQACRGGLRVGVVDSQIYLGPILKAWQHRYLICNQGEWPALGKFRPRVSRAWAA